MQQILFLAGSREHRNGTGKAPSEIENGVETGKGMNFGDQEAILFQIAVLMVSNQTVHLLCLFNCGFCPPQLYTHMKDISYTQKILSSIILVHFFPQNQQRSQDHRSPIRSRACSIESC
jgi:hypothetical protein